MKLRIHISFGREQWQRCGYRGRWWARARQEGQLALRRKHLIFSGAFRLRPRSSVGVQDLSQSVWVSQLRSRAFCFFHTARKKRTPKPKKTTKTKHWGAWGTDLLVSQWRQGCLAGPPRPAPSSSYSCCRLGHHCCLQSFNHHVSRPTGGIRNSKFSKQFQYFQYICWDFSTVHVAIRFSTSHTQTLVHFLFLASLYFVGPTQTATLKCSVQPCRGRTPHPFQYHGWSGAAERSSW